VTNHNSNNERIKRAYFTYLKEAKRHSEATVDAVAKALDRFESYTRRRDFKAFHFEQAVAFKKHLGEQKGLASGEKLSKATLHARLAHLKRFFQWLAGQPGYKSRLQYSDADYFNLSDKDTRIATARREQTYPTIEQVRHVIASMPVVTEIDQRNRALIAFTLLTGARDSAIASFMLKHLDMIAGSVHQDAREVQTKFSKTFMTFFFPVGDEVREIVADWVKYLREVKLWGNASPIRSIFREAFVGAGLPYFNPHSFRHTLARLGETICQTPEQFKAWSQNLGHEGVLTTFYSYGDVPVRRQGELIQGLGKPQQPSMTAMEIWPKPYSAKCARLRWLAQNSRPPTMPITKVIQEHPRDI
jgi:integrase